jgi:hypothetical protein
MTMSYRKPSICTRVAAGYALALLSTTGVVYADNSPDPLFTSEDIIEVRIEAPFQTLMQDRPIEEEIPALFQYMNSDGKTIEFDTDLRARGNFRRRVDVCDFTPIRLNFKKSQTKDTLFDHQDKLKLVTHCKSNSPRYEQVVLAFLIEHQDRLAKRIDTNVLETRMVIFPDLNPKHTNLAAVFHYFIGNTDFSPVAAAPGENCCHNHSLFENEGEAIYSIPYDFDMSGFVNAPHARPSPRLHLRNVRQRLYRGRCLNNEYIPESVNRFFERRDEIYALIERQEAMTKASRKEMLRFVDGFYKSLNSPQKVAKKLNKDCV